MSDNISEKELIRLRRLVRILKSKEGRGTELISLYIPAGRQIGEVANLLREEYSQAGNIKDRNTRHHVQEALTSIMQRLKLFNKAPDKGLIVFAGYVAGEVLGDEKMEIYLLEPPKPISTYLYRCDSRFHTEILEEMIKVGNAYGLVTIDREESSFAILEGSQLDILETITSGVPGKHRAGGQSARRFERIIDIMVHEFFKRIGERMVKYYMAERKIDGIVVGGPGPTKYDFLDKDYIPADLKKKILGVLDLGYSGEEGIYELLERSKELLQKVEYIKQKEEFNNFLNLLKDNPKGLVIGIKEVMGAVAKGSLEKLLMLEDVTILTVSYTCTNCGNSETVTEATEDMFSFKQSLKCSRCGSQNIKIVAESDETDNIIEKVFESGGEVIYISKSLNESYSLAKTFGGIVGILRQT
ncbi:MAG TPA: peptide chain release factor aRF-1 [Geobacterales bacterium]|nr:peptide chain release factor aRF-1 [Geobacterales bacterium]